MAGIPPADPWSAANAQLTGAENPPSLCDAWPGARTLDSEDMSAEQVPTIVITAPGIPLIDVMASDLAAGYPYLVGAQLGAAPPPVGAWYGASGQDMMNVGVRPHFAAQNPRLGLGWGATRGMPLVGLIGRSRWGQRGSYGAGRTSWRPEDGVDAGMANLGADAGLRMGTGHRPQIEGQEQGGRGNHGSLAEAAWQVTHAEPGPPAEAAFGRSTGNPGSDVRQISPGPFALPAGARGGLGGIQGHAVLRTGQAQWDTGQAPGRGWGLGRIVSGEGLRGRGRLGQRGMWVYGPALARGGVSGWNARGGMGMSHPRHWDQVLPPLEAGARAEREIGSGGVEGPEAASRILGHAGWNLKGGR
jgi:hypothetical protein